MTRAMEMQRKVSKAVQQQASRLEERQIDQRHELYRLDKQEVIRRKKAATPLQEEGPTSPSSPTCHQRVFVLDCDNPDAQANAQAQAVGQNRPAFANLIPMHRVHVPAPQSDLYKPLSSRGTLYEGRNQGLRASQ